MRVALDVMGGDYAPTEVLKGGLLAISELNVELALVGPKDIITSELNALSPSSEQLKKCNIVHASEVVSMSESPSQSFRKKKDSSIQVGLNLLKDKKVDAFVSAGNTGAVLTASTLVLGRLPNVERPGLATVMPSMQGPFVMLDVGSNVDCKPLHLAQYTIMGAVFAEQVLHINNPKINLLNIGEESEKGNALSQSAFELIKQYPVNFQGNIESKAILNGVTDVLVCDGFVGNSLIKFGEGVESMFFKFLKDTAKKSLRAQLGLLLLKPIFKKFKKQFDYNQYGGAPLLGVNGVSIVAHGNSNAIAIKSAIRTAIEMCNHNIVTLIETSIASTEPSEPSKLVSNS